MVTCCSPLPYGIVCMPTATASTWRVGEASWPVAGCAQDRWGRCPAMKCTIPPEIRNGGHVWGWGFTKLAIRSLW